MLHEAVFIHDLKHRKRDAFEALYCNYSKALYTILYSMLKEHSLCEDVLQDVFIKIWNHVDTFEAEKGSLFTWMASIAKNAARDTLGSNWFKNRKRTATTDDATQQPDTSAANVYATPIKKYVDHLGQSQKMIIMLAFYYGYTQAEIAALTNTPLGTVKTWNRKALRAIRSRILSGS